MNVVWDNKMSGRRRKVTLHKGANKLLGQVAGTGSSATGVGTEGFSALQ